MASTAYWALWFSPWDAPGRFSCHTCWISTSCPALHIHFQTQRNEMIDQCHKASKYLSCTTLFFLAPGKLPHLSQMQEGVHLVKTVMRMADPVPDTVLSSTPLLLFSGCRVQLFETPWTVAHQASLSFTISQSLCKFMFIESMMPSNHLILCCPLFLLPSIFPSISRALGLSQWAGSSHQMAKVLKHQHQSFQWIFRVDFL